MKKHIEQNGFTYKLIGEQHYPLLKKSKYSLLLAIISQHCYFTCPKGKFH